jgi:histidine ammonia-lyase
VTAFHLGVDPLTPSALADLVANPEARLWISAEAHERMATSAQALDEALARGITLYGVNTGFGGDAVQGGAASGSAASGSAAPTSAAPPDLQLRLARYLDAGSGAPVPYAVARGVLVARAHVLAKGYSAVHPRLVGYLSALFASGIAPWVPTRGSLGASGDLVTLAPLARLVAGDPVPVLTPTGPSTSEAMRGHLPPSFSLQGREALALMNGLSCAAAWIALSLVEAQRLLRWATASAAAAGWGLGVRAESWSEAMHTPPVSNHAGAAQIAAALRDWLADAPPPAPPPSTPIQDPYSLRAVPQALGSALEALDFAVGQVTDELETVSDNPIFLDGAPVSGANFFGSALVQSADLGKGALARIGDLLERQTFLLVAGTRGLPVNLVPPGAPHLTHGLKGVHQSATALAMALQEGAIPSAPFSRSAEGHNQDVVSNAMNGAAALARQVEIARELVAAHTCLAAQGVALAPALPLSSGAALGGWTLQIRALEPKLGQDTALRPMLEALAQLIATSEPGHSSPTRAKEPGR